MGQEVRSRGGRAPSLLLPRLIGRRSRTEESRDWTTQRSGGIQRSRTPDTRTPSKWGSVRSAASVSPNVDLALEGISMILSTPVTPLPGVVRSGGASG